MGGFSWALGPEGMHHSREKGGIRKTLKHRPHDIVKLPMRPRAHKSVEPGERTFPSLLLTDHGHPPALGDVPAVPPY